MSNGDCLFAHASTLLHYIVRKAPFGKARLLDDDVMIDFSAVTTPNDKVSVIATLPLTRDETWSQLAVDELSCFETAILSAATAPKALLHECGRGVGNRPRSRRVRINMKGRLKKMFRDLFHADRINNLVEQNCSRLSASAT